ncbi:MAG: UDP-N-acetylmuramate dehydrogenase [Bacteroidia bacterium]|nr:UDP-N-acetylmuramate dehydrogenase [Bacteroidia bacterium]
MKLIQDFSLRHLNTLGIDVKSDFYAPVHTVEELKELLGQPEVKSLPKLVLGGGSNILFTKDFPGLIIRNEIKGINILREDDAHAFVKAGGGEVWHEFVCHVIDKGFGGLENLSLIPGSVGASPIQNIGAYGVELKDVFHELEAVNLTDGTIKTFSHSACRFAYRDSIFKQEAKGKYLIASVSFRLTKNSKLNTSYGAIEQELKSMGVIHPGISEVSKAVINIRRSKLPDPAEIGNAGSFFKNPEVSVEVYEKLKSEYPEMIAYKTASNRMKLAAGWLIEQCGWKGKVEGRTGMHNKQALVLVNYGGATGEELISHARKVQQSIKEKFGVEMEMEVNIV